MFVVVWGCRKYRTFFASVEAWFVLGIWLLMFVVFSCGYLWVGVVLFHVVGWRRSWLFAVCLLFRVLVCCFVWFWGSCLIGAI